MLFKLVDALVQCRTVAVCAARDIPALSTGTQRLSGQPLPDPVPTNTIRSIATFRTPDGFACKARWRRHSCSTSSHLNAAGGFVRRPRRACLSARVDGVVVARCRLSYRLRAAALPHAPRDKLNEVILLIVLVKPLCRRGIATGAGYGGAAVSGVMNKGVKVQSAKNKEPPMSGGFIEMQQC